MRTPEFVLELFKEERRLYETYSNEFHRVFKMPLKRFWHMDRPVFGCNSFDLVAFDTELDPPDGTSLKEFILEKYGERAVQLIVELARISE